MTTSSRDLTEAIASASGGRVIDRPLANAVEVHGQRLVVTREVIRAHLAASGLGKESASVLADLERTTWEMLRRNATGRLTEKESSLIVEGTTEPGEEPRRAGCMAVLIVALSLEVGPSFATCALMNRGLDGGGAD